LEKKNLNKIIHQFLPIDTNSLSKKFLNHWKPDLAIFVESEIWPNFILNIKKLEIPLLLVNGRFTKKTFSSWKKIPNSAINIFNMFDLCFVANQESKKFLKYFKVKKIFNIGNLKYSNSSSKILENKKNFKGIFLNKKIWCASSTHFNEEEICGQIHVQLKKKISNLITIIIPRHINRIPKITESLKALNLSVHKHSDNLIAKEKVDIYLVDVYGATLNFYKIAQTIFLGGSLIQHGGQNPLEPARLGCKIFNGPNIQNFKEVYKLLNSLNISETIKNKSQLIKKIDISLNKPMRKNINKKKLEILGKKILDRTFLEINKFL
jgi:3-deoxy-D-manno-octulosonic-acid transferase